MPAYPRQSLLPFTLRTWPPSTATPRPPWRREAHGRVAAQRKAARSFQQARPSTGPWARRGLPRADRAPRRQTWCRWAVWKSLFTKVATFVPRRFVCLGGETRALRRPASLSRRSSSAACAWQPNPRTWSSPSTRPCSSPHSLPPPSMQVRRRAGGARACA